MDELEDAQLLREFVTRNSEDAFAELVRRHINLVYSAALRQLRNPHSAQEVAQAVFTILAQKAKTLAPQTIVTGWLYRTTRYACMTTLRAEIRRQKYEREACETVASLAQSESPWEEIAPRLDEAMNRLGEADRDALLLHYLEQKSFRQIGASLGTSEDAAQKRVSRALGKLRTALSRRKVTVSGTALITLLLAQGAQAAPPGTAGAVVTGALSHGAAPSTALVVKGTLKLLTWMKMKTALATAAALVLAAITVGTLLRANMSNAKSTPKPELQGSWEGSLEGGARTLRIAFHFTRGADGRYLATMDSIDQGARQIPVTAFSYTNRSIALELKSIKGRFTGEIATNGTEISGTFDQMGSSVQLTLKRSSGSNQLYTGLSPAEYVPRTDFRLQGYWRATVDLGGAPNRMALKIAVHTNSSPVVYLDALDQGMRDIPAANVSYADSVLAFTTRGIASSFRGTLNEATDEISGMWKQAGRQFVVFFRRANPDEDKVKEGSYSYATPREPQGIWTGTLDIEGNTLPLVMKIGKDLDGGFIGLLDSPDQGLRNVPILRVTFRDPNLMTEMPASRASYMARLENGKLVGTWQQGDNAYQFDLVRTNLPTATKNTN
jgi:RNA polymerase sigma factor (sigma-70 family)